MNGFTNTTKLHLTPGIKVSASNTSPTINRNLTDTRPNETHSDHAYQDKHIDQNVINAFDRLKTVGKEVTSKILTKSKLNLKDNAVSKPESTIDERSDRSGSEQPQTLQTPAKHALGLIRDAGKDMSERMHVLALSTKTKITSKINTLPHLQIVGKFGHDKSNKSQDSVDSVCASTQEQIGEVTRRGEAGDLAVDWEGGGVSLAPGDSRIRRSASLLEYEAEAASPPSPQIMYDPQVLEYVSRASHLSMGMDCPAGPYSGKASSTTPAASATAMRASPNKACTGKVKQTTNNPNPSSTNPLAPLHAKVEGGALRREGQERASAATTAPDTNPADAGLSAEPESLSRTWSV